MDGSKIKSILLFGKASQLFHNKSLSKVEKKSKLEVQIWNKRKTKLQSLLSKQNLYTSERLQRITNKRNNRVDDYLKKAVRYIVNYCIKNNIGTIVCGYNLDFK